MHFLNASVLAVCGAHYKQVYVLRECCWLDWKQLNMFMCVRNGRTRISDAIKNCKIDFKLLKRESKRYETKSKWAPRQRTIDENKIIPLYQRMTGKEISQKITYNNNTCACVCVSPRCDRTEPKSRNEKHASAFFARAHRRHFVRTMMSNLSGHFKCSENFVHNEKNVIVGHVLVALVRTQRIFASDWRWHCIGHALRHYPKSTTRIWPETFQMHNELKLWRWQSRMALSSFAAMHSAKYNLHILCEPISQGIEPM